MTSTTDARPAEFFHEHAGWSYDPETETAEQGRSRCAAELAKADAALRAAIDNDTARIRWMPDDNPDLSWADEDTLDKIDREVWTVEGCVLETRCEKCGAWSHAESLWGIVGPSDDPYRHVVEAELADQSDLLTGEVSR